jgi:signal transduction histidine kinase
VSAGSIVIHDKFLSQDRMALIDQQVRNTATSLSDPKNGGFRRINFEDGERLVSKELGPSRTSRMFVVWDDKTGRVLYESEGAKKIGLSSVPMDGRWASMHKDGRFIRILKLESPDIPNKSLQVGYSMDEELVSTNYFSKSSFYFFFIIFILGFAASLLLTSWLLGPISNINKFLKSISEESLQHPLIPKLPENLFPKFKFFGKDEFISLLQGLNELISKVNKNYKLSRLWAYQMAHELKTPLAILSLEVERIQKNNKLSTSEIEPLLVENKKISETVESFLAWAELENSTTSKNLYAIKVSQSVISICKRLERFHPNRINFKVNAEPTVLASPQHIEQMISNLITNALAYSDANKKVTVVINFDSITIIDQGEGIPSEIVQRLGEPFNRATSKFRSSKGSGLGLAWVNSICRFYNWKIDIKSQSSGTKISVFFPMLHSSQEETKNITRLDL